MRIAGADVIVTCPGRNFVTLEITTDDGLVGYGDATLNGRELAVGEQRDDVVAQVARDRDAHRIEDTWQYLYRGAYWRRGPVTMAAIAAVDVALWDIKAQAAGMPLYQLLGGASRTGIMAYGHASGRDLPELLDSVRARREEGFRSIRVQSGVPGLETIYGISAAPDPTGGRGYEPAGRHPRPAEETWDTRAYLRHLPTVFDAVRHEFGPELPLLHDVHHRLTPIQAAKLGKALEPYDLFWL
jgi:mannonate dehydratase